MVGATDENSLLNCANTDLNIQEREVQISLAKPIEKLSYDWTSHQRTGWPYASICPTNSTPFTLKRYFPIWAINYAFTCKIRVANNWESFQGRTPAKFVCYLSGI